MMALQQLPCPFSCQGLYATVAGGSSRHHRHALAYPFSPVRPSSFGGLPLSCFSDPLRTYSSTI